MPLPKNPADPNESSEPIFKDNDFLLGSQLRAFASSIWQGLRFLNNRHDARTDSSTMTLEAASDIKAGDVVRMTHDGKAEKGVTDLVLGDLVRVENAVGGAMDIEALDATTLVSAVSSNGIRTVNNVTKAGIATRIGTVSGDTITWGDADYTADYPIESAVKLLKMTDSRYVLFMNNVFYVEDPATRIRAGISRNTGVKYRVMDVTPASRSQSDLENNTDYATIDSASQIYSGNYDLIFSRCTFFRASDNVFYVCGRKTAGHSTHYSPYFISPVKIRSGQANVNDRVNSTDERSVSTYEYGGTMAIPYTDLSTLILFDSYVGGSNGPKFEIMLWNNTLNSPSPAIATRAAIMSEAAMNRELLGSAFRFEPATEGERLVVSKKTGDHTWLVRLFAFESSGSGLSHVDSIGSIYEFTLFSGAETYATHCSMSKNRMRIGRTTGENGSQGETQDARLTGKNSQMIFQLSDDEFVFLWRSRRLGSNRSYSHYKVVTFRDGNTHVSGQRTIDKKDSGDPRYGLEVYAASMVSSGKVAVIGSHLYTPSGATSTAEEVSAAIGHKHAIIGVSTEDATSGSNVKIATSGVVEVPGANYTVGNNYYSDDGVIRKGEAGDALGAVHLIGKSVAPDKIKLINNDWDLIL